MDMGSTRTPRTRSVWESRMKSDEVKGGIKVFNGEEDGNSNNESRGNDDKSTIDVQNVTKKQSVVVGTNGGKRKTWKSESLEGSPIQIAKQRSEMVKNLDEKSKELSVSVDEGIIKKSPIRNRKTRSMVMKEMSLSLEVLEKSPNENKKTRSQSEKATFHFKKTKSELFKSLDESSGENASNSPQLMKSKSQSSNNSEENGESCNGLANGVDEKAEKGLVEIEINRTISENKCTEIGVGEEKVITSHVPPKDVDEEFAEIEVEKKKNLEVKKNNNLAEQKGKQIVVKENNIDHINQRKPTFLPPIVKKQSPSFECSTKVHLTRSSKTNPSLNGSQRIPRGHTQLQSFVDLVMWRDVSRSTFVFGTGAFFLISSSYTNDLNISFISVISYLGLVYLAAIFLFRSFIPRGNEMNDYVLGEEEACRLVKLSLPYINEFLLNLKALFSGDPATTIKMAVMLYVLARCGSSITIWKMAKLSFFVVFTVPKICSSYSTQLTDYSTFWIRRFGDVWESCTHKKAVSFAIFTFVWKLSSSIARIWAVFMLFVVFRYYQQSMGSMKDETTTENIRPNPKATGNRLILVEAGKQKRIY